MTFDGGRGPIYNIIHQFKKVGIVETDGTGRYRLIVPRKNCKMQDALLIN